MTYLIGFGMYKSSPTEIFTSMHVLHAIALCKEKGYSIPGTLTLLTSWVSKLEKFVERSATFVASNNPFPRDILTCIFSHLPREGLLTGLTPPSHNIFRSYIFSISASLVCKQWYNVSSSDILWRPIYFSRAKGANANTNTKFFKQAYARMKGFSGQIR